MNFKSVLKRNTPIPIQQIGRLALTSGANLTLKTVKKFKRVVKKFKRKPRRWKVNLDGRNLVAQEYAGYIVLYSEGTSLMSRLRSTSDLYDPEEVNVLWREIEACKAQVFMDIGTNIGLISLAVLKKFPHLRIEAFEPGPHQYGLVEATIKYNRLQSQIQLHQVALGNDDGETDFFVHVKEHASGDGLLDTGRAGHAEKIHVSMQKLDTWWTQSGKPDIPVVKIDTEGAELLILKGAVHFLAECKPTLLLEIWPENLQNYPYKAQDILIWLNKHGYELETLSGDLVQPSTAESFWGREYTYVARPSHAGIIPKKLFKPYLPNNPVIVEAGAHVGWDTVEMSKLWPKGFIHAFEPVPELFSKLEANTSRLQNVTRYPLALSDRTGSSKIYISSGASDASSSLLRPKEHLIDHPDVLFETETEIQTITLDDWAEKHRIERVDALWLDMQGYELSALKSSPRILKSVSVICTEVNLKEVYAGVPLYAEMRTWLEDQGFQVGREELAWHDGGNVLFIRQKKSKRI